MAHHVLDPGFRSLLDENVAVRMLATDFVFTEGPIWHPKDHYLLFSDIPRGYPPALGQERRQRGAEPFQQG